MRRFPGIDKFSKEQAVKAKLSLQCRTHSHMQNQGSESNGSLMRISPLIVFCVNLETDDDILEAVENEISLTHPDTKVVKAAQAFVLAIVYIIRTSDPQLAYSKAEDFVKNKSNCEDLYKFWWQEVVEKDVVMEASGKQMGWVKIAWTYAFLFLKNWTKQKEQAEKEQINLYVFILT